MGRLQPFVLELKREIKRLIQILVQLSTYHLRRVLIIRNLTFTVLE